MVQPQWRHPRGYLVLSLDEAVAKDVGLSRGDGGGELSNGSGWVAGAAGGIGRHLIVISCCIMSRINEGDT